MPIEFRCTNCDKLLRTKDETAGKKTKCPECGTVLNIPEATTQAESESMWSGDDLQGAAAAQYPPPDMQDSANPYRAPQAASSLEASERTPTGAITPTKISVGDVYSRTWALFKRHLGPTIGFVLLLMALLYGSMFAILGLGLGIGGFGRGQASALLPLLQIPLMLFQYWIMIGAMRFLLNLVRTGQANFGLVFSGGPWLLRFLGGMILFSLAVGIGFLLLVIPGFIAMFTWWPVPFLIVDQNEGVIQAFKTAAKTTRGNRLTALAIYLLTFPVMLLGVLACGVGVIPAIGFVTLLYAVTYLCMIGQPPATGEPHVPPRLR